MSIEKSSFVTAVILAAGVGSRMRSPITKQRMVICGESVLKRCVRTFDECSMIDAVVVVCREDERKFASEETREFKKVLSIVNGGNTRAESARKGFEAIPEKSDFVAIHDAVRCLVTVDMIESVVAAAFENGAATAAKKITDSVKRVDSNGIILESVPRDDLFAMQTPQVFRTSDYSLGLSLSHDDATITDDNMIVERVGVSVRCVECGSDNIKITTPEDIVYAKFIIKRRNGDG